MKSPLSPPRFWHSLSLRGRLLIGVLGLVALGLAVAALATRALLASFLLNRFDNDQQAATRLVAQMVFADGGPGRALFGAPGRRGAVTRLLPVGSYAAAVTADGRVVEQFRYDATDAWVPVSAAEAPRLPSDVASRTAPFTAYTPSGAAYRMVVVPRLLVNPTTGVRYTFIWGMPLREVDATLRRLTIVEIAVAVGVLVGVGYLAWFVLGLGLRPLRAIERAADDIAAGQLSRRVAYADTRNEVGRLGAAFNTMVSRIEEAFAVRAASEERLRRFLADASHELRTPLTSIRGYAELFRRGAARRPDDLEKAMRRIEEEATRMGVLVDELLLLARLDQGRQPVREPVLLAELVADACEDFRAAAPDRQVRVDADPDVVVSGDELQLRQVVTNLLTNVRVHTPPGTPVNIRLAAEHGWAVLEVTDYGLGLPAADLPRVFDRFYRADPSRTRDHGGAGLGLAIVASVVQAHGGRVGVRNVPGAGACFRVELPLLAEFPSNSQLTPNLQGQVNHMMEPDLKEAINDRKT